MDQTFGDIIFTEGASPVDSLKCADAFDSESSLDEWLWRDEDRQMKLSIWPNIKQI